MMQLPVSLPFWSFHSGDLLVFFGVLIALVTFRSERKKDRVETRNREDKALKEQTEMHSENKERLDRLLAFKNSQDTLNAQRERQVAALETLATTTAQSLKDIAFGLDRRVQNLENRRVS